MSAWNLVPCLPTVAPDNRWTAMCTLREGYSDEEHSHWVSPEGVEVVTVHRTGERVAPNCAVRKVGS